MSWSATLALAHCHQASGGVSSQFSLAEEASPNGMTRCDNGAQIHKTLFKLSPREPNKYVMASAPLGVSQNVGNLPSQSINGVSRTLLLTIIAIVDHHFQVFGKLKNKMSVLAD
jgi:hypothetical protein